MSSDLPPLVDVSTDCVVLLKPWKAMLRRLSNLISSHSTGIPRHKTYRKLLEYSYSPTASDLEFGSATRKQTIFEILCSDICNKAVVLDIDWDKSVTVSTFTTGRIYTNYRLNLQVAWHNQRPSLADLSDYLVSTEFPDGINPTMNVVLSSNDSDATWCRIRTFSEDKSDLAKITAILLPRLFDNITAQTL